MTEDSAWWASLRRFGMKPGLERTQALLERLGHPEQDLAVVHVGGTNGKGSTVAMTAAGLTSMGLRVGRYTSPDLGDVRERVTLNGDLLPEADWRRLADRVEAAAAGLPEAPTRFEALTALAFLAFRDAAVDVAVLEVGLGGRYDATNVVKAPWVTALTSVALDHQAVLGPTLTHIAADKCGIFKPGAPVVSAVQAPPVRHQIVQHANAVGVPVHWARGRAVTVAFDHTEVAVGDTVIDVGLAGAHQARNAAVAWTILTLVGDRLGRSCDAARPGLRAVRWPGRLEAWPGTPPYLLDGAHNLHGASALAAALAHPAFRGPWHLVFGALADKPGAAMLRRLLPRVRSVVLTSPESRRAGRPEEWIAAVPPAWRPEVAENVPAAMATAERRAQENGGGVLVAGSFDLVGPVRHALSRQRPS
jgi:dihydrofolate synthase/folylpolyglutamate synthase